MGSTAITNWLRAGTDLYPTMRLAGHQSPKVTERYAGGLSDDELARMARPAFSMIYGKKASESPDEKHRSLKTVTRLTTMRIVNSDGRGASSAAEQGTFNPLVEGSNPSPLTGR